MSYPKKPILFTLFHAGSEYRLQTYQGEYRNLQILIADNLFLEDFGQCGGMGRCATCMIEINGLPRGADTMQRNEPVTLSKSGSRYTNVRLACQIPVNDDLANVAVQILESGL